MTATEQELDYLNSNNDNDNDNDGKATKNDKMDENKCKCYGTLIASLIVIGSILYTLISIMTPIAAIIGGNLFNKIFNEYYTISEINTICNDKYNQIFIWNNFDLGTYGQYMYIFGIIDLIFILCFAVCICSWFLSTFINKQLNWTVTMNIIIRVFFMICWVIFGQLIIDIYIQFNNQCDQNTKFSQEMNDIFIWLIPIFSINIGCTAITFMVAFISCICCCKLDFRFF